MPSKTLLRNLRLLSGLVLMAFVIGHLTNLALGLHSVAAMGTARWWLLDPWRHPLGGGLLALCAGVHTVLGLYAISARRSWTHDPHRRGSTGPGPAHATHVDHACGRNQHRIGL